MTKDVFQELLGLLSEEIPADLEIPGVKITVYEDPLTAAESMFKELEEQYEHLGITTAEVASLAEDQEQYHCLNVLSFLDRDDASEWLFYIELFKAHGGVIDPWRPPTLKPDKVTQTGSAKMPTRFY